MKINSHDLLFIKCHITYRFTIPRVLSVSTLRGELLFYSLISTKGKSYQSQIRITLVDIKSGQSNVVSDFNSNFEDNSIKNLYSI
jgi:hypothetical protein